MEYKEKALGTGKVRVYTFGDLKLHAYETGDGLADECYVIESANELVGIEIPTFEANIKEYKDYIDTIGKPLNNVFIDLHPVGASFFDGVKFIGTKGAKEAIANGSTRGTLNALSGIPGFDSKDTAEISEFVDGKTTIDGVEYEIKDYGDEYDIIIPAMNVVYTHMLGSIVHSIVGGVAGADAMLEKLNGYKKAGYDLILTSHFVPEGQEAVDAKIAYIENEKKIAGESKDAEEFKAKMKEAYPDYLGENYLDMSAGFFFA
ncbi:hypothetical protein IJ765_00325 [Candidatus Saccharibacteria bacterium]|nr:hypothetical protein [Candidatus Saccharibacteria bacterium]